MLSRVVAALVAIFLAAGCDDEPVPEDPPPDLTGNYDLVSLMQGGVTLGPPLATGTFSVKQTSVMGQEANGTVSLKIMIPIPPGVIEDSAGTYKNRLDGSWEQSGNLQTRGTYTLVSDTLTVIVTEPPAAVSTTVWKR